MRDKFFIRVSSVSSIFISKNKRVDVSRATNERVAAFMTDGNRDEASSLVLFSSLFL